MISCGDLEFPDPRVEWRISAIKQALHQKANYHEVSTISGHVDSLERALREVGAEIAGLRAQIQTLTDQVIALTEVK